MTLPSLSVLPERFLERLREIIPSPHLDSVLDTFIKPRNTCFRVNTLKSSVDATREALKASGIVPHPVSWYEEAFWIYPTLRQRLLDHRVYREGQIYLQNLSSMIPPLVLNPQPGENILDLTAAPGSKTLQIAALMQNTGRIVAVEKVRPRYYRLLRNIDMQGASNVTAICTNGAFFWKRAPESFDRVLLDAPCSTEGRIHAANPDSYRYWSERKIHEMTQKQKRLIYSAIQALKPGGILVYSTCSFAPEENEAIIAHALKKFGDAIEPIPIALRPGTVQPALREWRGRMFPESVRHAYRILPSPTMEAFFVCKLVKKRSTYAA